LKKKQQLGQELADGMRVGEGRKTDCGVARISLPSMIRETPHYNCSYSLVTGSSSVTKTQRYNLSTTVGVDICIDSIRDLRGDLHQVAP
ncbi:MAG TPA: hypothetical protein VEI57_11105, partial [Nitrospirota bacterium]|nr:hypothetical protein [Nitrospirota bacterium]